MFYAFRVNQAIAQLGLRPTAFTRDYRLAMFQMGRSRGQSPEEVALHMAAQLPLLCRPNFRPAVVKAWIENGKLDTWSPEMQAAFRDLGLWWHLIKCDSVSSRRGQRSLNERSKAAKSGPIR